MPMTGITQICNVWRQVTIWRFLIATVACIISVVGKCRMILTLGFGTRCVTTIVLVMIVVSQVMCYPPPHKIAIQNPPTYQWRYGRDKHNTEVYWPMSVADHPAAPSPAVWKDGRIKFDYANVVCAEDVDIVRAAPSDPVYKHDVNIHDVDPVFDIVRVCGRSTCPTRDGWESEEVSPSNDAKLEGYHLRSYWNHPDCDHGWFMNIASWTILGNILEKEWDKSHSVVCLYTKWPPGSNVTKIPGGYEINGKYYLSRFHDSITKWAHVAITDGHRTILKVRPHHRGNLVQVKYQPGAHVKELGVCIYRPFVTVTEKVGPICCAPYQRCLFILTSLQKTALVLGGRNGCCAKPPMSGTPEVVKQPSFSRFKLDTSINWFGFLTDPLTTLKQNLACQADIIFIIVQLIMFYLFPLSVGNIIALGVELYLVFYLRIHVLATLLIMLLDP